MKKSTSSTALADFKSLKKEVASLKKQVAKLQKVAEAASKPGKLRATRAVVDSLQVVDASGALVAEIDSKGNLFCRTVWASTGKNTRGVFIDGVTFRKVSAGALELIGTTGNTPGLEAMCWPSAGHLTLRSLAKGSKQSIQLQGDGAPFTAFEEVTGKGAAQITVNGPGGGQIRLFGTQAGSKAEASVAVSHLTNAGRVYLTDAQGSEVGKLP